MLFKKNKTNYFFDQFALVADYALRCSNKLNEGLKDFTPDNALALKNEVHAIEHEADKIKHETEERLAKEFMTPIDREDIFLLLDAIDDLTDAIDDVPHKLYLRNYQKLPEFTADFAELSADAIEATVDLIKHLNEVTDKSVIDPLVNRVRSIEEEADRIYEEKVHHLYTEEENLPQRERSQAEKVYSMFEYITDKCKDISKEVDIIMYKNL